MFFQFFSSPKLLIAKKNGDIRQSIRQKLTYFLVMIAGLKYSTTWLVKIHYLVKLNNGKNR